MMASRAVLDDRTEPPDWHYSAVGWSLLAGSGFLTYTAVAWSSPVPLWVQVGAYGAAILWPGDRSPKAAVRALMRRREAGDTYSPAPARERVSGRVWAYGVGACGCAGLLAWAWATGRWWVLAVAVLAASGVIVNHFRGDSLGAGIRRADSLSVLSSGGGAAGLASWRADLLDRWYMGVLAVPALTLRAPEDPDAPEGGPRPLVGWAAIVDDDVRAIPGGAAFGVDTRPCGGIAEDVAGAVGQIRRFLDASVVLVEPVPAVASVALVTAYRGQPWYERGPVDWRELRPVVSPLAPVGLTAHADLLSSPGQSTAGRPAVLSSRLSTLIVAAADAGKTGLVRAYLRGLLVQDIPHVPVLVDNKGDYPDLAAAVQAMGGVYVSSPADYADALDWAYAVGESRYADTPGYEHVPTLDDPLVQVVISEWIDFVEWAQGSKAAAVKTALRQASTIPRRHRASSINLITTGQGAQQRLITAARDFFPQRAVLRVDSDSQVDMALGDGSLRRGAHAHLIPLDCPGVFYARDRRTGWPYQGRAAWIPETDQRAALIDPMTDLGRRMRAAGWDAAA